MTDNAQAEMVGLIGRAKSEIERQRETRGDMLTYGSPDPLLVELTDAFERMAGEVAALKEALEPFAGRRTIEEELAASAAGMGERHT